MNKLPATIKKRFDKLKGGRPNWDSHWQDIADLCLPRKDDILRINVPGEKKQQKVFDATAGHCVELLASALHTMMTNPVNPWMEYTTGDPELDEQDEVRDYLQKAADITHLTLNSSNFQTEVHEMYINLVTFGTGTMVIEEDDEFDIRFQTREIGEIFLEENNKGLVDTVFRTFKWSLRNIVLEFGEDVLEDHELKRLFEKEPERKLEVIHSVFPVEGNSLGITREDLKTGKRSVHKFASVYTLRTKDITLNISGFREFPYVTPRWTKIAGEIYGRSPAMKSLPDIQMINEVEKTRIRSAQKMVDPPLQLPDDGILLPLNLRPGGLNYYRAGTSDRIEPLQTGGRPDLGERLVMDLRDRIRQAFFIDQLQLQQGPQMTATEVLQRTEENLRILGPMLGRQGFEFLRPMIERVFPILSRKNKFPEPPEVLEGKNITVKYVSMVAKSQKTLDGENFTRVMNIITPLAGFDPSVMDIFNLDKTSEHIAKTFSLPQDILRGDDELAEIREQRAEASQQQQAVENQVAESQAVNNIAPHLLKAQELQQGN